MRSLIPLISSSSKKPLGLAALPAYKLSPIKYPDLWNRPAAMLVPLRPLPSTIRLYMVLLNSLGRTDPSKLNTSPNFHGFNPTLFRSIRCKSPHNGRYQGGDSSGPY